MTKLTYRNCLYFKEVENENFRQWWNFGARCNCPAQVSRNLLPPNSSGWTCLLISCSRVRPQLSLPGAVNCGRLYISFLPGNKSRTDNALDLSYKRSA